jgi:protein-S-isoprenylcysteine O-methyltransferase Ste14
MVQACERRHAEQSPELVRKTGWELFLDLSVALVWALFAAASLDGVLRGGGLLDAGRFLFNTLLAYFFLRRRPAVRTGVWWENILGWAGAILPMVGLQPAPGGWSVPGLAVQAIALIALIAALISLGRSVGIAPADRGLVTVGLYRYVRHPMYAAELWFFGGYLMANPSWRNLAVFVLMVGIQVIRILREERIVRGYAAYAHEVRWRLVPLIW